MKARATKHAVHTANPPMPQPTMPRSENDGLKNMTHTIKQSSPSASPPGKREAVDVRLRLRVLAGEHRVPRTCALGAEEVVMVPERASRAEPAGTRRAPHSS